jgi:hypothetical protein
MQVIIYKNNDGDVFVITPTQEVLAFYDIEAVAQKDVPFNNSYTIIDDSDLPTREFRNAWVLIEGSVSVNFIKAQEITKDRLRAERAPLLAAQDVAFQRALETGADTALIVAEKQRLRDITKLVDSATTLAELQALSAKIEALT